MAVSKKLYVTPAEAERKKRKGRLAEFTAGKDTEQKEQDNGGTGK